MLLCVTYKNNKINSESGMVLVVTLLILMALTLLMSAALRSCIFDIKIVSNIYNRAIAFEAAESELKLAEAQILGVPLPAIKSPATAKYQTHWLSTDEAGNQFFEIDSIASYRHTQIHLHEIYRKNKKNEGNLLLWKLIN